jgi:hypothetical protein
MGCGLAERIISHEAWWYPFYDFCKTYDFLKVLTLGKEF